MKKLALLLISVLIINLINASKENLKIHTEKEVFSNPDEGQKKDSSNNEGVKFPNSDYEQDVKQLPRPEQKTNINTKESDDWKIWASVIGGFVAVIVAMIIIGTSWWVILLVVLGIVLYFAFLVFMLTAFIENGFDLEWYWWLLLILFLGGIITGSILLLGMNIASSLVIAFLLYITIGLTAIIFLVFFLIFIFKAIISAFTGGRHSTFKLLKEFRKIYRSLRRKYKLPKFRKLFKLLKK